LAQARQLRHLFASFLVLRATLLCPGSSIANIRRTYQYASVWFQIAREVPTSRNLFNRLAIFTKQPELVHAIAPEMIVERLVANDTWYTLIPIETPEHDNVRRTVMPLIGRRED
jgi:hypothetical protein